MAKEKTVELKPKLEKISEEHLNELQTIINNINRAQFSIGKIESQKHKMLHELAVSEDKVTLFQEKLDKEYGTHDVNIADGKINWPKENSDEK
jgi:hypothetical protein